MIKLTRLNHQIIAINSDHISHVDATPDTTLALLSGERIIVRESMDELIELVVQFRRRTRIPDGDPPVVPVLPSVRGSRTSMSPRTRDAKTFDSEDAPCNPDL